MNIYFHQLMTRNVTTMIFSFGRSLDYIVNDLGTFEQDRINIFP